MAESPYKNVDYSRVLPANPLDIIPKDRFGNKVPDDPKDYAEYRGTIENEWFKIMGGHGCMSVSGMCDDFDERGNPRAWHRVTPAHFGNQIIFACDHVIWSDPVHPADVMIIPMHYDRPEPYLLCGTCFNLMERCKLDMKNVVHPKCGDCMQSALQRIMAIDPTKIKDLRHTKDLPASAQETLCTAPSS